MVFPSQLSDSQVDVPIMSLMNRIIKWFRDGSYDMAMDRLYAKKVNLRQHSELTIASGVIAPNQAHHTVDTQGDAASDDLDTIDATNFTEGDIIILRPESDARTIVLKHNTGNIKLTGGDLTLDDNYDTATLMWTGLVWIKV